MKTLLAMFCGKRNTDGADNNRAINQSGGYQLRPVQPELVAPTAQLAVIASGEVAVSGEVLRDSPLGNYGHLARRSYRLAYSGFIL